MPQSSDTAVDNFLNKAIPDPVSDLGSPVLATVGIKDTSNSVSSGIVQAANNGELAEWTPFKATLERDIVPVIRKYLEDGGVPKMVVRFLGEGYNDRQARDKRGRCAFNPKEHRALQYWFSYLEWNAKRGGEGYKFTERPRLDPFTSTFGLQPRSSPTDT